MASKVVNMLMKSVREEFIEVVGIAPGVETKRLEINSHGEDAKLGGGGWIPSFDLGPLLRKRNWRNHFPCCRPWGCVSLEKPEALPNVSASMACVLWLLISRPHLIASRRTPGTPNH